MIKLIHSLRKEFLLITRDLPGLVILFVMPVMLIFVVTLAQDRALRNQQERTKVLFVAGQPDHLANALYHDLDSSGFFTPVKTYANQDITVESANALIRNGEFRYGVVYLHPDSAIMLLVDPTQPENVRSGIVRSLEFIIRNRQAQEVMDRIIQSMAGDLHPVIDGLTRQAMKEIPPVRESFAQKEHSQIMPGVIQNNVPGFILFAMFFIVIPLSGSLITEKTEGSFQRLRSLPVRMGVILGGKVGVFLIVCLIQFAVMMGVGMWVFPALFDLPALETGNNGFSIAISTFASSLAAIGFGMIVGSLATTQNQAALFGSVMVVLLGVISGTFFPVHLMPSAIRWISHLSPMRWGIDNYIDLFIREASLMTILPNTLLLLLFFGLAMTISIVIFARSK